MTDNSLLTPIKIDKVNQIIADLYDDSNKLTNRIDKFFNQVNNLVYFEKANFLFYQKQGQNYTSHSIYTVNWSESQKQEYQTDYCHMDDVLSILDSDNNFAFLTNELFNNDERKKSQYFQEFLLPMGLHDSLEMNFSVRGCDLRGIFSIHRSHDKRSFTREDLGLMRLFQPHFSNVFKNYAKGTDLEKLFCAFDPYNCIGIGYFDSKFNLVEMNNVYKQYVLSFGYLDMCYNPITNCFRNMCRELSRMSNIPSGQAIEHKMDDSPLYLEMYKIESTSDKTCHKYMGVFFDLSHAIEKSINQAKENYGLTNKEIEILALLLKGFSNEQISQNMFISLPTVKKHISSIYDKMNINSQKQILCKLNIIK